MEYAIEFHNVTFSYEDAPSPALADINLRIAPGETVLITGPSGAGKTTLAGCLIGLVPHFHEGRLEGEVKVLQRDIRRSRIGAMASRVGLVFQDPESQLVTASVLDEIAFGPENLGVPREEIGQRVSDAIKVARLEGYENREPINLSGGEQQATTIAAIYAMHPEIYVMDEPTSNLDPLGTKQVLSLIVEVAKKRGKTLVIVEHKLEEVLPLVDRVVVMDKGRIIRDGSVREVMAQGDIPGVFTRPPIIQVADWLGLDDLPLTADQIQPMIADRLTTISPAPALDPNHVTPAAEPVIEVSDVWYSYSQDTPALRGVNLTVRQGEFVAILGRNGSGKTTLARHLIGLNRPDRGSITVLGKPVAQASVIELAQRVGFCFQNPNHQMVSFYVKEELAFGMKVRNYSDEQIEQASREALAFVGMTEYIEAEVFSLGKGLAQRLALASVLTLQPDILIVDEPATGQDPHMAIEIFELIQQLNQGGKTVLLITHKFDLAARYALRAVVMNQGRVTYDGPFSGILPNQEFLHENSLDQPQITRLAAGLGSYGVPPWIVTADQMINKLDQAVRQQP
ncbi:MAG: ABC transporter ATP-binding protein [Anaerolineales bacterium]|nr:MAG: ABC transporter ATP-binding protein [Anaerolineales bacterium]